jgi:patatin-like phospholipase/acyl hydrolase
MAKPMRVLSIDGGGIRGLIPASILLEVESMIRLREGPDARLADYFDLVAGTSTGGLIAGMIALPEGSPVRSAQDIVDFYVNRGSVMFQTSVRDKLRRGGGLADERYSSDGFNQILDEILDWGQESGSEMMLSELTMPTVIPTYNASSGQPYYFKSHRAKTDGLDFSVRHVALATAAAPTYFEAVDVRSSEGGLGSCVDGGVFANSPAMCAYAEAAGHFGYGAKDMAILSLGTGRSLTTYTHDQMRDWGMASWVKPMLDMMLAGSDRAVDHQVRQIFETLGPAAAKSQYLRAQADLSEEPPGVKKMDDVTPANLRRLAEIGREVATEHRTELQRFVDDQLLGPVQAAGS